MIFQPLHKDTTLDSHGQPAKQSHSVLDEGDKGFQE